jgi:hypothetical protein|tara:strand:- start:413 stop:610 length:198 start_codon:yes stop_codon:yes gene_type:complete
MSNTKLTSVKILENLYNKFKISAINSSMTLQKLTNRSMFLYLEDNNFQEKINIEDGLSIVSGSKY